MDGTCWSTSSIRGKPQREPDARRVRFGAAAVLWLAPLIGLGCATGGLSNPVVAHTGTAEARDGYEAAVVAVESQGYPIAKKDRESGYLRVLANPAQDGRGRPGGAYFDIQAWPSSVVIFVDALGVPRLTETEARRLHDQMDVLAFGIETRARILAGEPVGAVDWPFVPPVPVWIFSTGAYGVR